MNVISLPDGKNLNIDRKETYRYLGYHFGGSVSADPEIEKMVNELEGKLKAVVTPRAAYELYCLSVKDGVCLLFPYDSKDGSEPRNALLSINSAKLSAHIKECRYAILFAATIGPGADMMIRRYSGRSTVKPAVLQAIGAAAIEAFADEVTEQIRNEIINSDIFRGSEEIGDPDGNDGIGSKVLKMRFSPGYGDFSLEHQNDFFRILQLEKNLGMSLNSALLMSPSKSITAVIGVL